MGIEGDLRLGGEFRLYLEADDIDSTGRIDACEPSRRLVVGPTSAEPASVARLRQ
jgi:hypothetical protein